MSSEQRALTITTPPHHEADQEEHFRDIHALTSPPPPNPSRPGVRRPTDGWETSSHRSTASDATNSSENFTTISREFNALVLAGSAFATDTDANTNHPQNDVVVESAPRNLEMIGEGDEETNPLAIVLDSNPLDNQPPTPPAEQRGGGGAAEVASVQRVKKDEVEAKIAAWQNAKVAKVYNRFKREDAVINGWENEQVQQATSWMKKIERQLEEKRAKAMEKMQNDIAKAHRKAEERRASAEAKRGTKVARILEVANLMRAVGKAPSKCSFF